MNARAQYATDSSLRALSSPRPAQWTRRWHLIPGYRTRWWWFAYLNDKSSRGWMNWTEKKVRWNIRPKPRVCRMCKGNCVKVAALNWQRKSRILCYRVKYYRATSVKEPRDGSTSCVMQKLSEIRLKIKTMLQSLKAGCITQSSASKV